jgi:tetratricopeptide (TPR) repeat protein
MIAALLLALGLTAAAQPAVEEGPLARYEDGRKLSARRIALERLEVDPDDVEAQLVVALATWEEDGRHAQALARLKLADKLYKRREAALGDEGWRIEARILRSLALVASEMGEHDLYLATADRYDAAYLPKFGAERAWTLMTMGRLDEARALAHEGTTSDDTWQRLVGWNTLCALDARQPDRARMAETCDRALEVSRSLGDDDLVTYLRNNGVVAVSTLQYDRAEDLFLRAARSGAAGGWTNPWSDLVSLYIEQGRGVDAAKAGVQLQRWRMAQSGADRAQTRAKDDAILATLLLTAGEVDRARTLIDRCLDQPDRAQSSTATEATTRGGHTLLRLMIRQAQAERLAERAAEAGWPRAIWRWLVSFLPDPGAIADRAVVRAALLDGPTLRATVGEVDDGRLLGVAPWFAGEIVPIVGAGVAGAAVAESRAVATFPGLDAFFDALDAEIAWRAGATDPGPAQAAAEALPPEQVLLRARLYAIAADQATRGGDEPTALASLERAMQLDPGTVRRIGLRLPTTVEDDGTAVARKAAAAAAWSPRFRAGGQGFRLRFTERAGCLSTPTGVQLGCYDPAPPPTPEEGAPPAPPPTEAERAAALLAAVHDEAFALKLGLSTHDARSLDGSTVLDRARARERMDGWLEEL